MMMKKFSVVLVVLFLLVLATCSTCYQQREAFYDWSLDTTTIMSDESPTVVDKANNVSIVFATKVYLTNPKMKASSKFLKVMNGCHIDQSSNKILLNLSNTLIHWFSPIIISACVFTFLLVIPWVLSVYDDEQKTSENMSRYAYYTLLTCDLLFRLTWASSVGVWLLAVIRQPSPCALSYEIYKQTTNSIAATTELITVTSPVTLGFAFGMPSTLILTSTVLSLHTFEQFSYIIGAVMAALLPVTAVFAGEASMGQVLTAFAFGIIFHVYQTRTPQWMRLIDFVANIAAGFLVLPLVKHFYISTDFSFALLYYEGLILQIFSIMVVVLIFSFGFLKIILFKRVYYTSPLDVQFLNMKLVPERSELSEGDQQGYDHSDYTETSSLRSPVALGLNGHVFSILYNKRFLLYGLAFCAIALVVALRVAGHHINEALSFGKDLSN